MMNEMSDEMVGRVVERLKALADETRVRLLLRLKQGECNVTSLADELGVGQASVSKHLTVLRQVGILTVRREGTQSFYAVRDKSIFELCKLVCDGVVRHAQAEHAALGIEAARRPAKRARP